MPKMKRKEGFGREKGFWVKREKREIEIFEMVQNRVEPQKYDRSKRY